MLSYEIKMVIYVVCCNALFLSSYREICGLSFADKGCVLRIVGRNGMAYEVNTETGQLLKEFKVSKKSITSLAFSHGEYLFHLELGSL